MGIRGNLATPKHPSEERKEEGNFRIVYQARKGRHLRDTDAFFISPKRKEGEEEKKRSINEKETKEVEESKTKR